MKCWKCGREVVDGASVCPYCGAPMSRPAPVTETGRAMRMLYDRYGAQEVLTNGAYLTNGLADLADVDKRLRNQLKMALDAGLGRAYLEQLNAGGPDAAFQGRVKVILTEDAGLSNRAAGTLAGYFDEMIGWRGAAHQEQEQGQQPQPTRQAEKKAPGWNEIDRTGRYTTPGPEISRQEQKTPPPVLERRFFMRQTDRPFESIMIYLWSDTHQIESLEYSANYYTYWDKREPLRDGLESAGNELRFGTVKVVTVKDGFKGCMVGYHQKLGLTDLLRAEAQGFVPLIHIDRQKKKPEVFQLKFNRTADVFAQFLKQAGFKQGS